MKTRATGHRRSSRFVAFAALVIAFVLCGGIGAAAPTPPAKSAKPAPASEPVNLVQNKPTVPAEYKSLVDGNPAEGCQVGSGSFYVDLGLAQTAGRIILSPGVGHCWCDNYRLSASDDAKTWTVVWKTDYPKVKLNFAFMPVEAIFPPVTARYFKVDYLDGRWPQLWENEVELYAPGTSTDNLALGKPAVQSNEPKAVEATDGDYQTYTKEATTNATALTVDLGQNTLINRVRLIGHPHTGRGDFTCEVSTDNLAWTPVCKYPDTGRPRYDNYHLSFPPITARYVRFTFTQGSVAEAQIYGPGDNGAAVPAAPVALPKPGDPEKPVEPARGVVPNDQKK